VFSFAYAAAMRENGHVGLAMLVILETLIFSMKSINGHEATF